MALPIIGITWAQHEGPGGPLARDTIAFFTPPQALHASVCLLRLSFSLVLALVYPIL